MSDRPQDSDESQRYQQDIDGESAPGRAAHERELGEREELDLSPEDNELRAPGKVCARCGNVITADQDVRLQPDGHFVHEVCPLP
jgi:hypothetical protein